MITRRILIPLLVAVLGPLFACGGLLLPVQRAHAEAVTVIPPKFELFGNPGDIISEKLRVRNDGDTSIVYQIQVEDFQAAGEQGGVNLIDDPNAPTTAFSLKSWISVEPTRFTLNPGEERVLNYTIRIPKDGEPGGHYASILVKLGGQEQVTGGASVESNVGSLILMRVSGALTEKVKVENFSADKNYYQYGPVKFALKTKNEGNVHVAPTGTIVITDIFGKKVKEIPLTSANVLPNASRSINTNWEDKNMVGRFTATLVATYGQQKQTLTASTTFVVFPVVLIWIIGGGLILVILALTQRKKLRKLINKLTSD